MTDIIERLNDPEQYVDAADDAIAEIERLRAALVFVKSKLDYLQNLWGKEGVTDGIVDRVNAALAPAAEQQEREA